MRLQTGILKWPTEWAGRQESRHQRQSEHSLHRRIETASECVKVGHSDHNWAVLTTAAAVNEGMPPSVTVNGRPLIITITINIIIIVYFLMEISLPFPISDYNSEPSGSGALASSFDKSVLHISDWLTWEQNMIKIQSVLLDDGDAVRLAIEKQEVSTTVPP